MVDGLWRRVHPATATVKFATTIEGTNGLVSDRVTFILSVEHGIVAIDL